MNNTTPYDVKNIKKYHEDFIYAMSLPPWISKLACPKCNNTIGAISIREIGLKINTQHITNFFVGVCCQYCNYGYEFHIENKCKNLQDFICFLQAEDPKDIVVPDYSINPLNNNLLNIILKK